MNRKYTYRWTANEDYSIFNNNYSEESDYIITDGVYDFSDYLRDNGVNFEQDGNTYYVLDECEERTGEAYLIISEEDTTEELVC